MRETVQYLIHTLNLFAAHIHVQDKIFHEVKIYSGPRALLLPWLLLILCAGVQAKWVCWRVLNTWRKLLHHSSISSLVVTRERQVLCWVLGQYLGDVLTSQPRSALPSVYLYWRMQAKPTSSAHKNLSAGIKVQAELNPLISGAIWLCWQASHTQLISPEKSPAQ